MIRVVLDACVLVGSIRRHMLCLFASVGSFSPVWSDRILFETELAIPKAMGNSDMPEAERESHATLVCELLNAIFPEARRAIDAHSPPCASLPDPDDEHVLALALATGAAVIVTENLKDFPAKALSETGVVAINTDQFLAQIAQNSPDLAEAVFTQLCEALEAPQFNRQAFITRLKQVGLKRLAKTWQA